MFTATFLIFFLFKSIAGLPLPTEVPFIDCGRQANPGQLLIIGGEEVVANSWPWMVSISTSWINDDRNSTEITVNVTLGNRTFTETGRRPHNCGGVLINREWVLTAAHCLDNSTEPNVFPNHPPSHWRVTAGIHSRELNSTESSRWQVRSVRAFYYHPDFLDFTYTAFNDIAMIRLSSPVEFNEFVRPICLPRRRVTNPGWNRCYAAGWGTTAKLGNQYSLNLRKVAIPVVNHAGCKLRFGMSYNAKQHLCGGDWYNGNQDSCQGDSGGPLACQLDDGSWYVAGIISWGMGCGIKQTPGIYTNVKNYENWILSILISSSSIDLRLYQRGLVRA